MASKISDGRLEGVSASDGSEGGSLWPADADKRVVSGFVEPEFAAQAWALDCESAESIGNGGSYSL
jgi:hypothetical protein